jgi:hypothetical protein
MECWDSTPRLGAVSALPGSGKTRLLEIIELFVVQPRLSASMSPAAMVRIIAKARKENRFITVLYDELDVALSKGEEGTADLRSALNAGYRRNGVFTRCINSGADTADFPCYAPLAYAGIAADKFPEALATRTIFIHMKPRAYDEPKEDFELDTHPDEALPICDLLIKWCEEHKGRMTGRPQMPVRDRAADIWKPLVLIADAAGGDWPQRARDAAVFLAGAAKVAAKSGSDGELLLHIREAFLEGDVALHSDELVRRLQNREESPWNDKHKPLTTYMLSTRLKRYDIKSKQMKLGGVNRNGYERAFFEDAWKRHVDPLSGPPATNSTASTASTKLINNNKKVERVERVEIRGTEADEDSTPEPGGTDSNFDGWDDMPKGLRRYNFDALKEEKWGLK